MRHNRTTQPRQPEALGPDVLYNGSDWDAFVDARYVCSRQNSQDAWIEARRVYFEAIEEAAIQTADHDAYVAEWDAWTQTCQGDVAYAPVPSAIDTLERTPVLRLQMGDDLSRETAIYTYREDAAYPVDMLGRCDAYALRLPEGEISIEMDDNLDFGRKVHICFPSGTLDANNSAAQLLQLAHLLRRDDVFKALQTWAAQDRAAEARDRA